MCDTSSRRKLVTERSPEEHLAWQLRFAAYAASMEKLPISREYLRNLPEYSTSIPTGAIVGKRWKRNPLHREVRSSELPEHLWTVGEYVPHPDPELVGIRWYRVDVVG